jgi:hypothetical protein
VFKAHEAFVDLERPPQPPLEFVGDREHRLLGKADGHPRIGDALELHLSPRSPKFPGPHRPTGPYPVRIAPPIAFGRDRRKRSVSDLRDRRLAGAAAVGDRGLVLPAAG